VPAIAEFLKDVDRAWMPDGPDRIRLRLIGSGALMLQTGYERGTKDGDLLETTELSPERRTALLGLGGRGTLLSTRHRMYLELVNEAFLFLPQVPRWRPAAVSAELTHFTLEVLDVVDVVVSKLARFSGNDANDLAAMVDGGHVPHDVFVERFRGAVDMFAHDARADDLPKIVERFHRVERDYLGVDETEIELPSWI
jgi:hypothetical protein